MKKSNFKEIINYEHNPYKIEGIKDRVYKTKEDERIAVDKLTGEMLVLKNIPNNKLIKHDGASYTKVFKKELLTRLSNLSAPASNMFLLIVHRLGIHSDKVCLTEDDFLGTFNYSQGSKRLYYQSVTELVDKKVIAKVNNSSRCYWINPNIIFNGDRTRLLN